MRGKGVIAAVAVIAVCLFIVGRSSGLAIDWAWFSSIGHTDVFWTILLTKLGLFAAVFALSALLLWVNGAIALRLAAWRGLRLSAAFGQGTASVPALPGTPPGLFRPTTPQLPWRLILGGVALALGILIALAESGQWELVLRYLFQVPYRKTDPMFGNDIGFYLFSLPAWIALNEWMFWILALSAAVAGAVYFLHGDIDLDHFPFRFSPTVIAHSSALLGILFLVKAWAYFLDRYLLLYDDNGVVIGAGYTDVHVVLPVLWLLLGLCVISAAVACANIWRRAIPPVIVIVVLVFGGAFVADEIVPGLFERLYVKPSELQLESPYIRRNIALTREAYGLQHIEVKPFPAEQGLTYQLLEHDKGTVDNIRLWDWQPLMDTYAQLQEIRTYYKFMDVDVDRYHFNDRYQQVTIAAREIAPSLLSANAQTWVNLHLLFTHGNGVVMSPVTEKTTEGLPYYYLRDIPPAASNGAPTITQPRIYFGENTDSYVVVKTTTKEFDYPKGDDNVYNTYDGADGVPIGSYFWRSLFSWQFGDVNILLSHYITGDSRILIHRNIKDRVHTIAPFLTLDHDPYVVVSGGRLFWIQDAYTTSDWFPYAQPQGDIDYIRNSVKVVIDAYNGTATFYVADPADPIIATYRRIFPGLFLPLSAMPPDLQRHIRYPEDLFQIQALQYRAYHMDTPEVFYNREDLWQFPREPAAPDSGGGPGARMSPYYMMMRLPGEKDTQFFLMLPMVPSQRENMIAWMAARCDAPEYGKLIVYEFPKDKLVYGPFQIDARVNQNTEISQQISLWNQMGSRVIRGNLLVVPINNSILYVSPLYLRAESGQLPELKRVIAAYGDRVVMQDTLPEALAALFGQAVPAATLPVSAGTVVTAGPTDARAQAALEHYNKAIERLKAGDWTGFGAELDALKPLLQQLSGQH